MMGGLNAPDHALIVTLGPWLCRGKVDKAYD